MTSTGTPSSSKRFVSPTEATGTPKRTVAHLAVPAGALPATGLDVSASAQVVIKAPTVDNFSAAWKNTISVESPTLRDGATTETLIEGTATVTTPPGFVSGTDSGGWLWMQTIATGTTRILNGGTTVQAEQVGPDAQGNYHLNGIDFNFGYLPYPPAQGDQAAPGTFTTSDGLQLYHANYKDAANQVHVLCDATMAQWSDRPGDRLEGSVMSYRFNVQFKTWLMYRPPGSGSQFVPLEAFGWLYGGDVAWDDKNKIWTLSNAAPTTVTQTDLTLTPTPFPQWDRIFFVPNVVYRVSDAQTLP